MTYEVRISDWSSDVCSSDLVLCDRTSALTNADLQAGEFDFGAAAGSAQEQDGHMVWGVSERPRFNSGAIRNDAIRHKVAGDLGPVPQLGRASRRERVCRNV